MSNSAVPLDFEASRALELVQTLVGLRAGEWGRVVAVHEPGELGERLLEMGLTPGIQVGMVRHGPLGDPVQLSVRGALISVRRRLAETVLVTQS